MAINKNIVLNNYYRPYDFVLTIIILIVLSKHETRDFTS